MIITVLRTYGALASNAIIAWEALASAGHAIADAFVRAFHARMQICKAGLVGDSNSWQMNNWLTIGHNHLTNPCDVLWARAQ